MKKILYVVLDGLGDRPNPLLQNKTPLEAAKTPNMDSLAAGGKLGILYTVGKNIAPESDVAVISLLGYDAHKYYTGRGPLEAYAEGLDLRDGDVAFRVNFATVDGKKIMDRRVGRNLSSEEAKALAAEIQEKVKLTSRKAQFWFKSTIGHRGILVIRSLEGKLSGNISNTDPAYGKEGVFGVAKEKFENFVLSCEPLDNSKQTQDAAVLSNEFVEKSTKVLEESEVNKKRKQEGKLIGNVILMRDAGDRLPKFPSIESVYNVKFSSFVEMPVERGIALLSGMQVVDMPQPTADAKKDFEVRANMALKKIPEFDGLYIHLKGPDEPAHDGNVEKKLKSIEDIDAFFFGNLLPKLNLKDVIITVTADHSTPCAIKAHSADPVPLLIAGGNIAPDGINTFSEASCKTGTLGGRFGNELMKTLVEFAKE
ncbi:MAG: 2,3-bisphosphoglycerate-independent phosphoglycerate mutase [Candidatus Omnitrophota bacterium]